MSRFLIPAATIDDRSTAQRPADALVEVASLALGYANLPDHGGDRPQVMVTIPYHELLHGIAKTELGNAWLGGHQITPNTARMYACDAGIIPRCQIHHLHQVAHGGPTNLTNGTHICTFHHWLVHHTSWTIKRNTQGNIEIRRT